jgi:hypothetical protein
MAAEYRASTDAIERLALPKTAQKMFRGLRPTARLLHARRITARRIHTTPFLSVDKQRIDALLDPLTQKYADAKDEVPSS